MTADDLPAAFASIPPAWRAVLPAWTAPAQDRVVDCVRAVSAGREIAPADPFRALRFAAPDEVRVVILGQDPYPGIGVADGLAFSANVGRPASLRRVFDVLEADRPGFMRPEMWKLDRWAQQGVLLLNPTLTIEAGVIGSHMACGWQALTSSILLALGEGARPPAMLLWGRPAGAFFDSIPFSAPARERLRVLRTRHPSNDFKRQFMSEGSHFAATDDRVDWWALE